jgi:uncharacterized NAD(P)/FAD-binding protein YdhS
MSATQRLLGTREIILIHHTDAASAMPVIRWPGGPPRLTTLIRGVRASVDAYPGDWQDIVDALRPQIPRLWEQLPEQDQRLFLRHVARYWEVHLRHVARYWEVHRHRVPPQTAARIAALTSGGRLIVHRGRVAAASNEHGGLRVSIEHGSPADVRAGWLINCTGAATDITTIADPLLHHLLDSGLARPDPLRLGLDTDPRGAVRDAAGRPASDIVTLGPLLRGRRYETTAIPEIRDQAAALARHLLARQADTHPGSAA